MQCPQCGEQFTPTRSDAKFCKTSCRVKAHRVAASLNPEAQIINEVIDAHGRAYRTWATIKPSTEDHIDLKITSTFSGALKPYAHRTVWQSTLPREAVARLHNLIGEVIDG